MSVIDRLPHQFASSNALTWGSDLAWITGDAPFIGEPEEVSPSGGGAWMCKMGRIRLFDEAAARTWEALRLKWELGDTKIIVPRCAGYLKARFARTSARSTNSDGTAFSDGSLYLGGAFGTLVEPVAQNDVTAVIELPLGATLLGAEPFTLVGPQFGPRLYGVARILDVEVETNRFTVLFGRPAREDIAATAEVDFGDPRCVMRARLSQTSGAPEYSNRWATTTEMLFLETMNMA